MCIYIYIYIHLQLELHPQVHDRLVRASGFTPLIFGVPFKQALVGRVDGDSGIPIVLDGFPMDFPEQTHPEAKTGMKKNTSKKMVIIR